MFLIHEVDPQSRTVVIIVFAHVVRSSVRPHYSKQTKFLAQAMFATGETVGQAEWIIDNTCLLNDIFGKFLKMDLQELLSEYRFAIL